MDPEDPAGNNCTYRLSQAGRCPKSNAMFFAFRNFAADHRWSTVTLADTADKFVASRCNLDQCDIAEQETKLPRTVLRRLFC